MLPRTIDSGKRCGFQRERAHAWIQISVSLALEMAFFLSPCPDNCCVLIPFSIGEGGWYLLSRYPAVKELTSARTRSNLLPYAFLDTHKSPLTDDCQPTVSLSRAKLMAIRFAYQYRNLSIQPVHQRLPLIRRLFGSRIRYPLHSSKRRYNDLLRIYSASMTRQKE